MSNVNDVVEINGDIININFKGLGESSRGLNVAGVKYVVTDKVVFDGDKSVFDAERGRYTVMILIDKYKKNNPQEQTPIYKRVSKMLKQLMLIAKQQQVRVDYKFWKDGDVENQNRVSNGLDENPCYKNRLILTFKAPKGYRVLFEHTGEVREGYIKGDDIAKTSLKELQEFYGVMGVNANIYMLPKAMKKGIYAGINVVKTLFQGDECKKQEQETEVTISEEELQYLRDMYLKDVSELMEGLYNNSQTDNTPYPTPDPVGMGDDEIPF
jgi:hypothetical protein